MEQIIKEIEGCLERGYYFAALSLALTIPNVCASYQKNRRAGRADYAAWCNEWFRPMCTVDLDGRVVYALRCSVFHAMDGNLDNESFAKQKQKGKNWDEYKFFIPHEDASSPVIYAKEKNGITQRTICIALFVKTMVSALQKFQEQNPEFQHEYMNIWFKG